MSHIQSNKRRAGARLQLVGDTEECIAETVAFDPPTPEGLTDEEVLEALRRLPQQYADVVLLSDVEGMSYREIAGALKVPVGTVMSRLSRGRKLLRAELAAYAGERGIGRGRVDGGEHGSTSRAG